MPATPLTSRRELLKRAAMILGVGAVSPAISTAVLAAADAELATAPRFLAAEQLQTVATLADIIIPTTDTPGARAAGVHHYIDALLAGYFAKTHREAFMRGLAEVDQRAQQRGFDHFVAADPKTQLAIATAMDAEAYGDDEQQAAFFREFKELTLVGYYTSKIGATQELAYQPIPGTYKGCVSYKSLGRAWAI
jgi:gluconate 2-dehydrogenase gamma chain